MEKDFITDEGKVTMCDLNISKMTLIEFMYNRIFVWGYAKRIITTMLGQIFEFLKLALTIIINLLTLIFIPIIFILDSFKMHKDAIKNVDSEK